MIWGFVYGATAMSSAALPLAAVFPFLPLWVWAILMGLAGFAMVWWGKYATFEKITAVLVGMMFRDRGGAGRHCRAEHSGDVAGLIPMIPSTDGGIFYTLALAGIFVIAMLIVGAEVVPSAGVSLSASDEGLLDLYGALGSLFMPFLALALLGLLNGRRIPKAWANKLHSNVALGICALLFIVLGIRQFWTSLSPLFGG
jgi:Mn2+/Fe2+ NRAMP family transporter